MPKSNAQRAKLECDELLRFRRDPLVSAVTGPDDRSRANPPSPVFAYETGVVLDRHWHHVTPHSYADDFQQPQPFSVYRLTSFNHHNVIQRLLDDLGMCRADEPCSGQPGHPDFVKWICGSGLERTPPVPGRLWQGFRYPLVKRCSCVLDRSSIRCAQPLIGCCQDLKWYRAPLRHHM